MTVSVSGAVVRYEGGGEITEFTIDCAVGWCVVRLGDGSDVVDIPLEAWPLIRDKMEEFFNQMQDKVDLE